MGRKKKKKADKIGQVPAYLNPLEKMLVEKEYGSITKALREVVIPKLKERYEESLSKI